MDQRKVQMQEDDMKPAGSGMKKGYKFDKPRSTEHCAAISKSLMGREIPWASKIADAYKDNDIAHDRNLLAWKNERRCTYICTAPSGRRHTTINLTKFCKRHGLSESHMCRIARRKIDGNHSGGSKFHYGWDCRKVKHKNRKW